MPQYDPAHVHEGSVLLAGFVPGGGLTMFTSEELALHWLLEADGRTVRTGRRVIRFQVTAVHELKAVIPPPPYLEES